MTELAKFIFEQTGSVILSKKQVAPLINKSVGYIDKAIHENRLEKIPKYTKYGYGVEFHVEDVAEYLSLKKSGKNNKKVA